MGDAMKISHIRSQILVLPGADPLAGPPENPNAARPVVILQIGTDDGIEGAAALDQGVLVLSNWPGLGFAFNWDAINRFGAAR
jgi:hypothetical protein